MQSVITLVIFWQKDDIQQTFYDYTRKICMLISVKDTNSGNSADNIPKSVWRQDDTYERAGGRLSVVRCCDSEGVPINGDDNEGAGADGMRMSMWTSMLFGAQTVTKATETTRTSISASTTELEIPMHSPKSRDNQEPTSLGS